MSSELEQLLDEATADGIAESSGQFTLNSARAQEQMTKYRLETPEQALLYLISQLVRSGCRRLEISQGQSTVDLFFQSRTSGKARDSKARPYAEETDPLGFPLLVCLNHGFENARFESSAESWLQTLKGRSIQKCQHHLDKRAVILSLVRKKESGFWNRLRNLLRLRCVSHRELSRRLVHAPIEVRLDNYSLSADDSPPHRCLLELLLCAPKRYRNLGVCTGQLPLCKNLVIGKHRESSRSAGRRSKQRVSVERHLVAARPADFGQEHCKSWRVSKSGPLYDYARMAHLWLPSKAKGLSQLVFVRAGLIVGTKSWESKLRIAGAVSAEGLDMDVSGLRLIHNSRLDEFVSRLEATLTKAAVNCYRRGSLTKGQRKNLERRLPELKKSKRKPAKTKAKKRSASESSGAYQLDTHEKARHHRQRQKQQFRNNRHHLR